MGNTKCKMMWAIGAVVAGVGMTAHAAPILSIDYNNSTDTGDRFDSGDSNLDLTKNANFIRFDSVVNSDTDGFDGTGLNQNDLDTDFDADNVNIQLTGRLHDNGTGNSDTDVDFVGLQLNNDDADGNGNIERFLYEFDTSLFNTSTFTTVTVAGNAFTETSGGGSDGVPNFGLDTIQLVAPFDTPGNLDFDVQNVSIVPVPEPASLALLGLGGLAMLGGRRRKRA